jgi:hypothetical protein
MNKTIIIGIDCAVEDKNTGVAVGIWSERDRQLNLISKHGSNKFLTNTIIVTILTFLTPYYERWNVGGSPAVTLNQGGVPAGVFLEPTSQTDLYGLKVGLGVNF